MPYDMPARDTTVHNSKVNPVCMSIPSVVPEVSAPVTGFSCRPVPAPGFEVAYGFREKSFFDGAVRVVDRRRRRVLFRIQGMVVGRFSAPIPCCILPYERNKTRFVNKD